MRARVTWNVEVTTTTSRQPREPPGLAPRAVRLGPEAHDAEPGLGPGAGLGPAPTPGAEPVRCRPLRIEAVRDHERARDTGMHQREAAIESGRPVAGEHDHRIGAHRPVDRRQREEVEVETTPDRERRCDDEQDETAEAHTPMVAAERSGAPVEVAQRRLLELAGRRLGDHVREDELVGQPPAGETGLQVRA